MTKLQNSNALRLGCVAASIAVFGLAHAQTISATAYNGARTELRAAYKAERDACSSQTGNAKDICVETAKGREDVAMKHLAYQRSNTAKNGRDLAEARYKARYEIAKEMCDDQTGDAKNTCVSAAKAQADKAKADIKMNKAVTEARDEARETKDKADYKVANERCDTLQSAAKDSCVATARARYSQ